VEAVADNVFVLSFHHPHLARSVQPGQFVNIRVEESVDPLLRRPFSVYYADRDTVQIIFNVVGKGTSHLRYQRPGDIIDVLGPLGVPFGLDDPEFGTGVLVAGGLGVAPMPLTAAALARVGKGVLTCLGARTAAQLARDHLPALHVATDDGTEGFGGNAVELAGALIRDMPLDRPKIFACGPTAMLRAVGDLARALDLPCEVSLEGPMGCGFGICQGCPVELVGAERKYALMCKDGPTFDVRTIKL
jgi:dihydroorotate dehydrogenase electron transfer subunit